MCIEFGKRKEKYKMSEIAIATRNLRDALGNPRTFHYAITVDGLDSGPISLENYGVHIWEDSGPSVQVRRITTSATRIDELLTLLVDNLVGPAAAEDVIADWL